MPSLGVAVSLLAVLAVVGVVGAVYQRSRGATRWVPRGLRMLATAVTLAVTLGFAGFAWRDSGVFGLVLVGVPVLCCFLALGADMADYRAAFLTTIAATGLVVWSLITVVGLGLYFLGPAVLLAAAAATGWQHDRMSRTRQHDRPVMPFTAH